MSIARRIRVRIARLHRAGNPVSLGQSRAGFVLAALLVASWQLSTPAQADVASQGSSYNEYFRIEWNYDMDHGLGVIRLAPWGEHLWRERVLEHGRFITAGLPFSILDDGEFDHDVYGPPTFEGVEDGRVMFRIRPHATSSFRRLRRKHRESTCRIPEGGRGVTLHGI